MPTPGKSAPALSRRAFCFLAAGLLAVGAHGASPPTVLPELAQIGKPNAEQAARLVEQFRTAGIPGDYYLEFELRSLPRRGTGPTLTGRWWGTRNDRGTLSRIEITGTTGGMHRFILQNGDGATVWQSADGGAAPMKAEALLAPLTPEIELTAFDLMMPFLYWPNPTVEKITRMLGRPAHQFLFPAPPAFTAVHPGIGAVRAWLDTQFNAPTQIEIIGPDGRARRSFSLLELKNVGGQHLPKSVDYRNELTRDKTRLQLTAGALNLSHPSALFAPATLTKPATPIDASRLTRIDP
ncbi:MAG: hypothetical protein JNK23_13655 [Opitutaceae bacterium]|nr:hypothetical protein [Opitutaceae bacterium]